MLADSRIPLFFFLEKEDYKAIIAFDGNPFPDVSET